MTEDPTMDSQWLLENGNRLAAFDWIHCVYIAEFTLSPLTIADRTGIEIEEIYDIISPKQGRRHG